MPTNLPVPALPETKYIPLLSIFQVEAAVELIVWVSDVLPSNGVASLVILIPAPAINVILLDTCDATDIPAVGVEVILISWAPSSFLNIDEISKFVSSKTTTFVGVKDFWVVTNSLKASGTK